MCINMFKIVIHAKSRKLSKTCNKNCCISIVCILKRIYDESVF